MILFLFLHPLQEAIACICEKFSPSSISMFVENLINDTLEKSSDSRILAGRLLNKLVIKNLLLAEQYQAGLSQILQWSSDLIIDIPNYFTALGEIIGK